jgi:cobalt-zinc-cadmium efflux system outer membrane protein
MKKISNYLLITLLACCITCSGQTTANGSFFKDTIHLSLDSSEHIFLRNNLLVLAQRYNVDAQKALIIQAKLLPNPNFSFSRGPLGNLHDSLSNYPESNFTHNSENAYSFSQLFLLARKINKQVKIAEANSKLAEYQLYDLIRTLKYTLRSDFFNIYYMQQSAKVYDKEIKSLQQVVDAFNKQAGKGYIAEKEVVRVKAQLYSLQSEYNDLINQINDTESELRLVLQIKNVYVSPIVNEQKLKGSSPSQFELTTLIDTAYKNRTDLQIAQTNTNISRLNYTYQKALAVPDITASINWDKQGSYARNLYTAGVAFSLPFFNRNQGNIKSAKSMINFNTATQKSVEAQMEEQIERALQKTFDNQKLYQNIDPKFSDDFDRLLNEVLINYQKRNLGLLDFLDFYDSYKQNTLQINGIRYNLAQSFEDINFYTGTNFFN